MTDRWLGLVKDRLIEENPADLPAILDVAAVIAVHADTDGAVTLAGALHASASMVAAEAGVTTSDVIPVMTRLIADGWLLPALDEGAEFRLRIPGLSDPPEGLTLKNALTIYAETTSRDWTPWHLDADMRLLWTKAGGYVYEVDLDSCSTAGEVLDWVFQINGKEWDGDAVAGLVNAFDDILQPQANLCSWGQSLTLDQDEIHGLVAKWKHRHEEVP